MQNGAWVHQADMLETKHQLSELVLAALERYLASARAMRPAAEPGSPSVAPGNAAHFTSVSTIASFLQAGSQNPLASFCETCLTRPHSTPALGFRVSSVHPCGSPRVMCRRLSPKHRPVTMVNVFDTLASVHLSMSTATATSRCTGIT